MKMIDINAVFIREAKQAWHTHRYINVKLHFYTWIKMSRHKQNYCGKQEIFTHVVMTCR